MLEKATVLKLYRVLKTALLVSKVVSTGVVKSVSDTVVVSEDKTVFTEHPETENKKVKHDKRIHVHVDVRIPEVWTITDV